MTAALASPSPTSTDQGARISFRRPVSSEGYVDAAWWPRSRSLADELPALLDALWAAGREVIRITYNRNAWDTAPRRMDLQGRTVRLGGFTTSDPVTVRLSDAYGRERIDVVVIAPDTDPAVAERTLQLAAKAGGTLRPAELLDQAAGVTA